METFPTLYKRTSTGKIQQWKISVFDDVNAFGGSGAARIETLYGQTDGLKQLATEMITEGKNIGKANETSYFEQAVAQAKSQWEKKLKKEYVQNIEDAKNGTVDTNFITGGVSPMLAHKYEEQGHKIEWPAYVQPKLDGHRCIAIVKDGKATLWSRTRKRILSMPHIERQLEAAVGHLNGVYDGELYNHDYRDKFEQLTSKIRQSKPVPGHEVVQFFIYDIFDPNNPTLPFAQRVQMLDSLNSLTKDSPNLIVLDTTEAVDEDEMIRLFGVFLEHGFEGLMVRNKKGAYKNKRSYDLQKVKTFQDSEFKVVAIEEGKGKMAGLAMFVCDAGNGKTFRVKMKGTLESLRHYYDNPEPWIGKELTVKYQGLSADGIPRFPVAERFRVDV